MAGDRIIVAITVAAEARSEPIITQQWIVWSIYNRVKSGRYPSTMSGVCLQRWQFSEWNMDIPDRTNLGNVLKLPEDNPEWLDALSAYDSVMQKISDGEEDPTKGATHFYGTSIPAPSWTVGATFVGQQGDTRFYSNVK
jgi:N-acetylmuramoyl-L-alanine amidase